jgi:hypothetical protein
MKIEIDLQFAKPGQVEKYESIPLVATLKVEQTVFANALDLSEFLKSFSQGGLLPLFTCEVCGTFGCRGYYAQIEHTEDSYIINRTYEYLRPKSPIDTATYEVPWWQLKPIVRELRQAIVSIPHTYPHLEKYMSEGWLPTLDDIDEGTKVVAQKSSPKRRVT